MQLSTLKFFSIVFCNHFKSFSIIHDLKLRVQKQVTLKNSGEKIKFGPQPPGPLGAIFSFF